MDNWKSHKVAITSIVGGAILGLTAWSSIEVSICAVLLIPVFLHYCESRRAGLLFMVGYFLAGTNGIVQGVAQFPGGSWSLGVGVWILSATLIGLPYLLILKFRRLGWLLVTIIFLVPPMGFLNWVSPLMISGYIFPGLGSIGLLLTVGVFTLVQLKPKLVVVFLSVVATTQFLITPPTQSDFVAVNTHFPTLQPEQINFSTDLKNLESIYELIDEETGEYLVFPESSVRHWTDFTGSTISSRLADSEKTILLGVQYPEYSESGEASWINSIALIDRNSHRIIYKQGTPIPYFMWKPGQNGYQRNINPSVISINQKKVKMLICYEVFTLRTLLTDIYSINNKPDVFITIGNYAWAHGTNLETIYRKKAKLISRLFLRPFVVSTNFVTESP